MPISFLKLAAFICKSSIPASASRRGALIGLASGLLATHPSMREIEEAEARKRGKGRKKRKNKNRKNKKHKNKKRNNQKPETRADATCPEPSDFSLRNPDGNNRFAQTFTAGSSGPLVSAQLKLTKDVGSSGDYILRLSPLDGSGIPTNEVLSEATVANADVPDGSSNVPFSFADPFSVKAGAEYALVLTRGEGVFGWSARGGDACAGTVFQSPDQTAPFTEGVGGAGKDFIFTAFVQS